MDLRAHDLCAGIRRRRGTRVPDAGDAGTPAIARLARAPPARDRGQLPRHSAAVIAGPALGGLVYVAGPGAVYAVGAALFALTGLFVQRIRAAGSRRRTERITLDTLPAGIRGIRSRPAILGAISLDLFAVLPDRAIALLPV
jgi:hypothetical protein